MPSLEHGLQFSNSVAVFFVYFPKKDTTEFLFCYDEWHYSFHKESG